VRLVIVLSAILGIGLAACGESEPAADTTVPSPASSVTEPPPDLEGRAFVSQEVIGHELVEGTRIRLNFDGQNLGAHAGCNQIGGTWSLDDDVLVVPEEMAMTAMACDPPALMDQDSWLVSFLSSRPTIALEGDTLTLSSGDVTLTMLDREVAEPDRPLEGTQWTVEGLVSADAASSVPAGVRTPTLHFDAGRVTVDAGCNRGSGDYEATEQDLTFGPIAVTRMACDNASMEVEAHVLGVLEGTVAYTIEADVLTLTNGDLGLVLRAGP
jgi:heat shock protein HslJ